MRTQLWQGKWPEVKHLFTYGIDGWNIDKVPPQLFESAKKVAPFSEDGFVYVKDGMISSHRPGTLEKGSSLSLPIGAQLHEPRKYYAEDLQFVSKMATLWDEMARDNGTLFEGNGIRGIIWHEVLHDTQSTSLPDEDIPF